MSARYKEGEHEGSKARGGRVCTGCRIHTFNPHITDSPSLAYPGILFGGGVQQVQLRTEDRKNGDLGALAPLVRGSGGSCNLVQQISFRIVKFS